MKCRTLNPDPACVTPAPPPCLQIFLSTCPINSRACKYLVNLLMNVFQHPKQSSALLQSPLADLFSVLLACILDSRLQVRGQTIKNMTCLYVPICHEGGHMLFQSMKSETHTTHMYAEKTINCSVDMFQQASANADVCLCQTRVCSLSNNCQFPLSSKDFTFKLPRLLHDVVLPDLDLGRGWLLHSSLLPHISRESKTHASFHG